MILKTADSGLDGGILKFKHPFFESYTAGCGEAAEFAVAADYAMAGDEQRQWIFGKCATNSPGGVGSA